MKKKGIISILTFAITLIAGCGNNEVSDLLEKIDVLLSENKVDSAKSYLADLPFSIIKSKADSAYYYLLEIETYYRLQEPIPSGNNINYSLDYYLNTSDKEKQARAYYYKGVTGYKPSQNRKETILLLKQAEEYAKGTSNLLLKHKIYESLSHYNSAFYEKEMALVYSKKALQVAKVLNDNERKAIAFLYLAGDYSSLGKKDSLAICIQECLSLANFLTEKDKAYLYTRMGELYEEQEPEMAKKYLQKAIDIYPQLWTYLALSNIYLKEQNVKEAKSIWERALQMNESMEARMQIFKVMRQQSIEQKDYLQANSLADSVLKWQQKYNDIQEQERIAEIQAKYDKETVERNMREKVLSWGLALLILVAAIISFLGYKSYKGIKVGKELAENKVQLEAYTRKAAELESSGKASAREISDLHQKINELHHHQAGILAKGKELGEAIEAGGTIVRWSKGDFINYLEYYKLKDLPFVNQMETNYERLSPKYIFFAVLEHEGKSDEDIQHIMGISESTLRSTRSRINSKKL